MTILEFVCETEMGPPEYCSGGRSYWCCPYHDDTHPSFSTLPVKAGFKNRFKCWGCGKWGDELDVLMLSRSRDEARQELQKLRKQYEAMTKSTDSNSPRGCGVTHHHAANAYDHDPLEDEFSAAADQAIEELLRLDAPTEALMEMLTFAARALEIFGKFGLHPLGLAGRCRFEVWTRAWEIQHMAKCKERFCSCACCQLARGWSAKQVQARQEKMKQRPANRQKEKGA